MKNLPTSLLEGFLFWPKKGLYMKKKAKKQIFKRKNSDITTLKLLITTEQPQKSDTRHMFFLKKETYIFTFPLLILITLRIQL